MSKDGKAAKVEWARDSDWRFMPTVHDERVGFILHPVDLAVNKVLALAGRDEPRPSDEIGCLYYSATQQSFVDPRDVADSVPHFGRPGGVLPRVTDS